MNYSLRSLALTAVFHGSLFFATAAGCAQGVASTTPSPVVAWHTTEAEHVYGFPEIKAGKKGSLTMDADTLTFETKSAKASIPRSAITTVSNGSDRVEMWGTKGRIVRMVIPNGGGLAAAAVMHHRVGMMTVDYVDAHGGKHAAVFNMPPDTASAALASFAQAPGAERVASTNPCAVGTVDANSVLVVAPNWDKAEVPAAYRGLVYEHVIARLKDTKNVTRVYRDGELTASSPCPQYTVRIAIQSFRQGNQVKRAAFGPIGMFVGSTQLVFDARITDVSGHVDASEQVKATVRTESESTTVADKLAKSLAKHYVACLKSVKSADAQVAPSGKAS